jgi:hypothetical protein
MKRVIILTLLTSTAALFSVAVLAGQGNGAPPGAHYNLNIIGVEKAKTADMTGSNRHTIFVPLKSTKTGRHSKDNFDETGTGVQTAIVNSKIWLVPGDSFAVCDGNGFDEAYGCPDTYFNERWVTIAYDADGNELPMVDERKNGAVFQLPCNTNLNGLFWDSDGDGVVEDNGDDTALDELVRCNMAVDVDGNEVDLDSETDIVPTASYQVWARALGKPGGSAVSTTCATVHGELQCSLENAVFTRSKGKSTFADVTDSMTSLVIGYCQDVVVTIETEGGQDVGDSYELCVEEDLGSNEANDYIGLLGDVDWTRIALFAGNTKDWFWNYDNDGLRLAQLRFYTL